MVFKKCHKNLTYCKFLKTNLLQSFKITFKNYRESFRYFTVRHLFGGLFVLSKVNFRCVKR